MFFCCFCIPSHLSIFEWIPFIGMCAHGTGIPHSHGFNQTFHILEIHPVLSSITSYFTEGEDGPEAASVACARPRSECHASQICGPSPPTCRNRRTRAGRIQAAHPSSPFICSPPDPASFSHLESVEVNVLLSKRGSCSCSMDESWFVTPPPCFTAEGATAEASPMEDLLIEHPSMSVYVSPGPLPAVEESTTSLAGSVR